MQLRAELLPKLRLSHHAAYASSQTSPKQVRLARLWPVNRIAFRAGKWLKQSARVARDLNGGSFLGYWQPSNNTGSRRRPFRQEPLRRVNRDVIATAVDLSGHGGIVRRRNGD